MEINTKILFGLLLAAALSGSAEIRFGSALSVAPVRVEDELAAGEEKTDVLHLMNETPAAATYTPTVQDFVAEEQEHGTPKFIEREAGDPQSIIPWISFDVTSITLEPGEARDVTFHLRVPETAAPGGYYGAILFGAPAQGGGVTIDAKVGALLLISVSGDAEIGGTLTTFETNPRVASHLPVRFAARFQNTGDVHVKPTGTIVITNILGQTSATLLLNAEQGNVLPNSTRQFAAYWQRTELPAETPEITRELKNFAFGPYRAIATITYGEQQTTTATITFWVIPWQLLILIALLLVALGALLRFHHQRAHAHLPSSP